MKKLAILFLMTVILFTACKKENEPKPNFKKVTITKVTLTKFPSTKSDLSDWDDAINGTFPDVYYDITKVGTTEVLYSGPFISNVVSTDLPLSWNTATPYLISDLNVGVDVDLYDYDSVGSSDYMGTVTFTPKNHSDFPNEVTLNSANGKVSFKLTLSWGN